MARRGPRTTAATAATLGGASTRHRHPQRDRRRSFVMADRCRGPLPRGRRRSHALVSSGHARRRDCGPIRNREEEAAWSTRRCAIAVSEAASRRVDRGLVGDPCRAAGAQPRNRATLTVGPSTGVGGQPVDGFRGRALGGTSPLDYAPFVLLVWLDGRGGFSRRALCASAGDKEAVDRFPNQPRRSDDWRGDALGAGREVRVPAAHDAGVPNRREAEVERGPVRVRCDANVLPVEDVLAQFRIPVRRGW